MPKAIAIYDAHPHDFIKVGYRATVFCLSHERQELCNRPVHTSLVQRVSDDGVFETMNTIYKPVEE